jgi:hypothetical protein
VVVCRGREASARFPDLAVNVNYICITIPRPAVLKTVTLPFHPLLKHFYSRAIRLKLNYLRKTGPYCKVLLVEYGVIRLQGQTNKLLHLRLRGNNAPEFSRSGLYVLPTSYICSLSMLIRQPKVISRTSHLQPLLSNTTFRKPKISMLFRRFVTTVLPPLLFTALFSSATATAFGNPQDLPIWCGKSTITGVEFPYPPWRVKPKQLDPKQLLNLRIYPRYSIFLENEKAATFVIDTGLPFTHGESYCSDWPADGVLSPAKLNVTISRADTGETLEELAVPVKKTGFEAKLSTSNFQPRFEPYNITIRASVSCRQDGAQTYRASTMMHLLPMRNDGGVAVRIDHKFGGMSISTTPRNHTIQWTGIFPYAGNIAWEQLKTNPQAHITRFSSLGFNVLHVLNTANAHPWIDHQEFDAFLDEAEKRGMYVMYSIGGLYTLKDNTLPDLVKRLKSRKSILTWFSAAAPDGLGYGRDMAVYIYNTIKTIDPYRPVTLHLACDNFYYEQYSRGDILMKYIFPIGITNTSIYDDFEWRNLGCDGCSGNLYDISERMDQFKQYQGWLNLEPKPVWGATQTFGPGEGPLHWARKPTVAEEVVMNALYINHDAKGILRWYLPEESETEFNVMLPLFTKALLGDDMKAFLLGAEKVPQPQLDGIDTAIWRLGNRFLFSVVNVDNKPYPRTVKWPRLGNVKSISKIWPPNGESWSKDNTGIFKPGMGPLEVNIFIVQLT